MNGLSLDAAQAAPTLQCEGITCRNMSGYPICGPRSFVAGWLARLRLELKANNVGTRCISQADSAVKSFAIPTDEQIVIAPGRAFRWPASELDLRGVEAFTR